MYRCCRGKLQPGLCEIVTKLKINKTWLPNATCRLDPSALNCPARGNRKVSLAVFTASWLSLFNDKMLPDIEYSQQPVPWEMLCRSWCVRAARSAEPSQENWDIKVWYAAKAILTLSPAHSSYCPSSSSGRRRKWLTVTWYPCSVASSLTSWYLAAPSLPPSLGLLKKAIPGFKASISLTSGAILGNVLSISECVKHKPKSTGSLWGANGCETLSCGQGA